MAALHSRENDVEALDATWQAIRQCRGHRTQLALEHADGEPVWVDLSVSPIGCAAIGPRPTARHWPLPYSRPLALALQPQSNHGTQVEGKRGREGGKDGAW